jgi:hypothetical protein
MIKISKNYIYTAIIAIIGYLLFINSNVISYRPVYVRAEELQLLSVEFAALTGFFVFIAYSLMKYKGYLYEKFIIGFFASLILTDNVYRLGFVQISDIFVFLAVFAYYLRNLLINKNLVINTGFLKKPPAILMTVTAFVCFLSLISPGCSYFYAQVSGNNFLLNLISWIYLIKIIFLFLFCHLLYTVCSINKMIINKCMQVLLLSGLIGCLVYWVQIGLFCFNLCDVNGIFNDFGFPRAKGLAHEPATFAHSLLFVSILSLFFNKKINKKIAVLMITTIATFSLGVYVTSAVCILVYYLIKFSRDMNNIKTIVGISLLLGILTLSLYSLSTFNKVIDKLLYHIQYKFVESNPLIDQLFAQYPTVKLFGVGLLNSVTSFAGNLEVRNSFLLLYQDTGIIGFSLVVSLLLYNLIMCFINSKYEQKYLLFAYMLSFSVISLSVIRLMFFPYLWITLTLFYCKSFVATEEH